MSTQRNGARMTHNPTVPWAMIHGHRVRQQARTAARRRAGRVGWGQRASAAISRSWGCWDRPGRSARSAWRRSERLARWPASRWLRSARRMIAHARVVDRRVWLSLYSSTTTLAPKMAYCSSRRTHWYSSAGDRSRAGRTPGLRATNTGSRGGWLPAVLAGGGDDPLTDGFRVASRHAEAVAGEGLAQRRPGGAELLGGGVDAAELLGELKGAFGFGPVGEEAAGLAAQPDAKDRGHSAASSSWWACSDTPGGRGRWWQTMAVPITVRPKEVHVCPATCRSSLSLPSALESRRRGSILRDDGE